MHDDNIISIWFFIGTLLLFYGVLICAYGVYRLVSPPPTTTVLAELHADIWWGAFLILCGAIYVIKFSPRRSK